MSVRVHLISFLAVVAFATPSFAQLFVPIYSVDPARRTRQLMFNSENMRNAGDTWERFWFLDQPSALTPYPVYRSAGPGFYGGVGRTGAYASGGITGTSSAAPSAVVRHAPHRIPTAADRKMEFERTKEEREAKELRELFALGERAESNGKTKLALIYYRMVANNATDALGAAAKSKLLLLANAPLADAVNR